MILLFCAFFWFHFHRLLRAFGRLSGDFVFDISLLQTILFALFAIMTLFQGRLLIEKKLKTNIKVKENKIVF
ncbi:hypothetical protein BWD14_17725 [Leptospira santarosai]|uniref:Uncharacterized protein n=1 Tax=Leptospira santarosai TaxID=28183 RepID=A0AB73LW77_9LEPT|nr:hypothetical protein BWD14_17725 [Leptospira santarosai]